METKQIATWLPCFSGFYCTIWELEMEETYELEHINDERALKGLDPIEWNDVRFDYNDYHMQVINGIARRLEAEHLKSFVTGIKVEKLVSPREYNFYNDSANITVTLTPENEKLILDYLTTHQTEFAASLKQDYTSCSGFISSYPNNIAEYMEGNPLEHEHKLGYILQFIARLSCESSEGIELDLYYDVEKYLSAINYDELVNPPKE